MTLILRLFLISALACAAAPAAAQTIGPRHFIADTLGPACLRDARGNGRSRARAARALQALNANAQTYVSLLARSSSLTPNKGDFEDHWQPVLFNAYAAAAARDTALARTLIDGMKVLAAARRYQTEQGLYTVNAARRLSRCYANGPRSPCLAHQPRWIARMYAHLMIAAAVLRPWMTDADRAVLLPWFRTAYRDFVNPETQRDQRGIYDFGNMGMAQLAYAALTDDAGLARRELSRRKRDFSRRINAQGYIDENSYRGVRAFWYHTYGLDAALSYALLARAWGSDFLRDGRLGPRLHAAVRKTALGVQDHAAFRAAGNRGGAYSTDPADSRAFVHQFALNLYEIAAREYGIRLPRSARHEELKRYETFTKISGFMAACYYSSR